MSLLFGDLTFPTVNTTSMTKDLKENSAGVDCLMLDCMIL
jgi:hypothetical protein